MPVPFVPKVNLRNAPTCGYFIHSHAAVRIIIGPLGSGKTVTMCAEVMRRALEQEPSPRDNIRYFKCAIVRNTMPDLKRTTIQSWKAVYKEDAMPSIRGSSPVQQHIKWPARKGQPGLDLLIDFMGLDNAEDAKRLLSYEGTMIWFNEIREIPKSVIDAADLRIGRYPSLDFHGVRPTWFGIIGDSNAPGPRNWLYKAAKGLDDNGQFIGRPPHWEFYIQPPAVIEMKPDGDGGWRNRKGEVEHYVTNPHHIMAAAGALWAVNPAAENLANLEVHRGIDPTDDKLGPGSYYGRGLANKTRDWIHSYYQVKFGFVRTGKPVIPEFDEETMVVDDLPLLEGVPAQGGLDIGGNTFHPAAVIGQYHPRGVWCVHYEVCGKDIGAAAFADSIKIAHQQYMPGHEFSTLWGDPAGRTRDGIFATSVFDHFLSVGLPAMPAPTNDQQIRIDAIKAPCTRLVPNPPNRPTPGILIHRRCVVLIEGLAGGWNYRQIQVPGEERYAEVPDKNSEYSDPCDAAGYWFSGGGETQTLKTPPASQGGQGGVVPGKADTEFNVFES